MELIFASNNKHKLDEVRALAKNSYKIISLSDIGCNEEIPETQPDLLGNALQKARYIFDKYQQNCFADDTGLEIESLNGRPGVYSARYAGKDKDDRANMQKVLKEMEGVTDRRARFRTVIALIMGEKEFLFEGEVQGCILEKEQGAEGFGYDPIFSPADSHKSFAEMSMKEKNGISHRGRAICRLLAFLGGRSL